MNSTLTIYDMIQAVWNGEVLAESDDTVGHTRQHKMVAGRDREVELGAPGPAILRTVATIAAQIRPVPAISFPTTTRVSMCSMSGTAAASV